MACVIVLKLVKVVELVYGSVSYKGIVMVVESACSFKICWQIIVVEFVVGGSV